MTLPKKEKEKEEEGEEEEEEEVEGALPTSMAISAIFRDVKIESPKGNFLLFECANDGVTVDKFRWKIFLSFSILFPPFQYLKHPLNWLTFSFQKNFCKNHR